MGLQTTRRQAHPQTKSPPPMAQGWPESTAGCHSTSTPALPDGAAKPSLTPAPGMHAI
jgi:hypothetical protein